jgi:hypothetical protein
MRNRTRRLPHSSAGMRRDVDWGSLDRGLIGTEADSADGADLPIFPIALGEKLLDRKLIELG